MMSAQTLTSLLWVVGGVGLAYLMMARGGGCGSHSHGSRGGKDAHGGTDAPASTNASQGASPADPVCGMAVANPTPALQRTHMGRTFSFCSEDCLRKFDADPARYAGEQESQAHRHAHGC